MIKNTKQVKNKKSLNDNGLNTKTKKDLEKVINIKKMDKLK